jgi:hypothetical protein
MEDWEIEVEEELPAVVFSQHGAAQIIAAALELLAGIEDADKALLPDEVRVDAERLRAIVDEHLEEE